MPRISTYDAPEGLGLRPTETGISAVAGAARRLEADYSQAAAAKEDTGRRFAQDIQLAGDVAVKAIDHQQISSGARSLAGMIAGKSKEWDDTIKGNPEKGIPPADPNDPTVGQKFLEQNLEPAINDFKKGFITENGQKWAEAHGDQFRQHMFTKTSADMATLAGEAAKVNFRQTTNALSNTVRSDPSSLDFSLRTLESSVGAMVDTSPNLTGTAAAKIKTELLQTAKEAVIKSAALGHIEKTGEVPAWATDPKFSPYINGAEVKQFQAAAKYYKRLDESESRAARVQRDYEAKNDFHSKVNELEFSLMPKNVGERPTLPADYWDKLRQLSQHPGAALEPGRLKSMVTQGEIITERLNKPEPMGRVSHETTMDLLQRMRSTDETRMADVGPIYDAFQAGKLNNGDFNFLQKEFANLRSPEGQRLGQAKTELFKAVRPLIDKSNPLMGKIDQDGSMNMYRFEMDLERKIGEYRKAGKDPHDLFDPAKPDFIGRPGALAPYQKPLNESIRDTAQRLGVRPNTNLTGPGKDVIGVTVEPAPPPKPLRKPGESAADYMKRIGM